MFNHPLASYVVFAFSLFLMSNSIKNLFKSERYRSCIVMSAGVGFLTCTFIAVHVFLHIQKSEVTVESRTELLYDFWYSPEQEALLIANTSKWSLTERPPQKNKFRGEVYTECTRTGEPMESDFRDYQFVGTGTLQETECVGDWTDTATWPGLTGL